MIKLYFPIEPVAKARPRVTRTGHCYTPQKTKDFEETIKAMAHLQLCKIGIKEPLEGVISISAFFFIKKPLKPKCEFPIGRPDGDNLIKSICDALNGVVWVDDSQICCYEISKRYSTTPSISLFVKEGFGIR